MSDLAKSSKLKGSLPLLVVPAGFILEYNTETDYIWNTVSILARSAT